MDFGVEQKTEHFEIVLMLLQQLEIWNLWIKQMNINYSSEIFRFVFLREKGFIQLGEREDLSSMQNTQIGLY